MPKTFPMLDGIRVIPWELGAAIYETLYKPLHGERQSLERIAERGGFGWSEVQLMARELEFKTRLSRGLDATPGS